MKHIVISSSSTELVRIPIDRLVFIKSDGNYSDITTLDGRKRTVSLQLGQIEDLLDQKLEEGDMHFIRVGRGLIINTDFIHFIDTARQKLILSDCAGSYHELKASREALTMLKNYVESIM